jgi:2C-methyl-D-erythritol 2,4-cyclodiphosphate synthase
LVLFLMSGFFTGNSIATEPDNSYLASKESFLALENVNDEAQAWATCSASLDILSNIMEDQNPNMALQLNNLSNGSDVAILMSQVSRVLADENFDINELNATITIGKLQMDEMPKAEQARILSDLEIYGFETMMVKLNSTLMQCAKNNETQKIYVDMMRDMAKSGVFTN